MSDLELTIKLLEENKADREILDKLESEDFSFETWIKSKENIYIENSSRYYSVSRHFGSDHEFAQQINSLVNAIENLSDDYIIRTISISFQFDEIVLVFTNSEIDKLYGIVFIRKEYGKR